MQVLKDELHHKILLEAEHLFLQRGYDRTSMQMIADKVNISKSNMYHYFKSKEEIFDELTDSAAVALKRIVLRLRDTRVDPARGVREYHVLQGEEFMALMQTQRYGLLLILEQGKGTRYEGLRESLVSLLAMKMLPIIVDEDGSEWMAGIMARNLIDGAVQIIKGCLRPRDMRNCMRRLIEYHTRGIDALLR